MSTTIRFLLGAAVLAASPAAHADRNYLILMMDDVGVDKISSYAGDFPGYAPSYLPATQTIDSLAAAGLRFRRNWGHPTCSPARVALQTGQHAFRTGIGTALGSNAPGVDPSLYSMLAEEFVARGYTTGTFGKWHLGTRNANNVDGYPASSPFFVMPHPARAGWERFFGSYDGYLGTDLADPNDGYFKWKRVGWLSSGTGYAETEDHLIDRLHATDRTVDVALDWINSRTEPWLAIVAFNAGHSGTTASSTWTYADVDPNQYRTPALSCLAAQNCADPTRQSYQGLVEHMDLQIEDLLNGMNYGILENTTVIVVGDNGTPRGSPSVVPESVFDQGVNRGKGSVFENGVRVPLIIADGEAWLTGVPGPTIPVIGREIEAKTHTLDLFNTLLGQAFQINMNIDSSDFSQCFTNNDVYCNFPGKRYGYTEGFGSNTSPTGAKAVVSYGEDTMTICYNVANACLKEAFYDTSTDPLENNPQVWAGVRANRLRTRFNTLHTGIVTWANPTGMAVTPFCAANVPACPS